MTLAQIINKARADLRYVVDESDLVIWANDIQEDIFTLDIPLFEKRVDFTSTDGTYEYTLSTIITGGDLRKIKEVFIDLENVTSPYDVDYEVKRNRRFKYLDFRHNDTTLYLDDDPDGNDVTVVYYKTPTVIDAVTDTPDLPVRWRRGIYCGLMMMAAEQQLKVPDGNWFTIYEAYKKRIVDSEGVQNKGADTVQSYSLI